MSAIGWPERLLAALGLPTTQQNIVFIRLWEQAEGTRAKNNPLATTQPAPGATEFNAAKVKNYPTEQTGLIATVQTLRNGRYNAVLEALRVSDTKAAARAVVDSPWGTGEHLLRLVGDTEGNAIPQGVTGGAATAVTAGAVDAVKDVGDLIAVLTNQGTWLRVVFVVGGVAAVIGGVVLLRAETVVGAAKSVGKAVPGAVAGRAVAAVA